MFLKEEDLIDTRSTDQQAVISARIKNKGIKYIEDQSEFSIKVPSEFVYQKIMGDQINASTSGNNSPLFIDSQNINVVIGDIKLDVEKKEFGSKQEVLLLLNQLNTELIGDKDPEKVKGILGQIKQKAAWVNEKILSHPLLAQVLAQILAKSLDLT